MWVAIATLVLLVFNSHIEIGIARLASLAGGTDSSYAVQEKETAAYAFEITSTPTVTKQMIYIGSVEVLAHEHPCVAVIKILKSKKNYSSFFR